MQPKPSNPKVLNQSGLYKLESLESYFNVETICYAKCVDWMKCLVIIGEEIFNVIFGFETYFLVITVALNAYVKCMDVRNGIWKVESPACDGGLLQAYEVNKWQW